jgi:excisionase family DNA binding protein
VQASIDLSPLRDELLRELLAIVAERALQEPSPWLTVKKASEYLDITEDAVRGLIKRREIKVYRPNGRVFIRREELDRWVTRGREVE